jgi:hypothetical protein
MGPENDEAMPLPNQFFAAVSGVLYGRTFMASTTSLMCLGPEETQAEDVIFVAMGADVPFVLCPQEDGNFKLVENAMFMASWMVSFLEARQIRPCKKYRLFEQDEFLKSVSKGRQPPRSQCCLRYHN